MVIVHSASFPCPSETGIVDTRPLSPAPSSRNLHKHRPV